MTDFGDLLISYTVSIGPFIKMQINLKSESNPGI